MVQVECSVETCDRTVKNKGWCNAHYMRWYQTGDVRAGIPLRLHNVDPTLRFWPKVDKNGPIPDHRPDIGQCWVYTAHCDRNGYGLFRLGNTHVGAHRFAYELENDPIPTDLELDHLCKNRSCVHPGHLELVTHLENMRRAYAHQTHCKYGHELTEDNTWSTRTGGRICKECSRRRVREHYQRKQNNKN